MAEQKTEARQKVLPQTSSVSEPFWNGAKEGKLMVQFDPASGKAQFYPRPTNVYTGRCDFEWREVSGKGKIYAWTKVHVPARGFEDDVPYVIAAIDLEEGARIVGMIVNADEDDLAPGLPVRVTWERLSEDINMFAFEPAA